MLFFLKDQTFCMALLWDNLSQQLNSVRCSSTAVADFRVSVGKPLPDDPSDRRRRLKMALHAIKNSGNKMMIESLNAAIEGREANLHLPELLGDFRMI